MDLEKEEAVKPPETSQELRNFVNTNFQGLVKNDFKFVKQKDTKMENNGPMM